MNKKDYVLLHSLLAKLKYELQIELLEVHQDYIDEVKKQIEAVDEVMKIFIVECE